MISIRFSVLHTGSLWRLKQEETNLNRPEVPPGILSDDLEALSGS